MGLPKLALKLIGPIRERALVLTAAIRVVAVTAFLGIGIAWTATRGMSPWILAWPLAVYLTLATLAFVYRRRALTMRLSWVLPFLDIGVTFLVHRLGISADAGVPIIVAAWGVTGLGAYTLIVALAGLSMPAHLVAVLTLLSTAAEVVILHLAGFSYWPMTMAVSRSHSWRWQSAPYLAMPWRHSCAKTRPPWP